MILLSVPASSDLSQVFLPKSHHFCPCKFDARRRHCSFSLLCLNRDKRRRFFKDKCRPNNLIKKGFVRACAIPSDGVGHNFNVEVANSARRGANSIVLRRFSDELDNDENSDRDLGVSQEPMQVGSNFTNFQQDPIVDKLRTQLGVIHPIPAPPINRNVVGLFVFFFFVGVVSDKIWNRLKRKKSQVALWRQTPTSFSMLLEKDLQRKESVEWVNMVLGKLWKVYRPGLENWIVGLLQPVIDDLKKPDYVERVEVKQFSLGDEPLSVRSVERRTSRRVNDLQYQIGLRYTGGARMLLMLSLKFGILPVMVPVGVQDFDIDGELWVKLRLIPTEPWVGAVQWAFVSLPKITFELSPFRLFNLMTIPVLSMFLTKLLTEDLPKLFVRPKKIVLDFQKGKAVGPVTNDFKPGDVQEKNKDFVGELSVTLVDARNLSYVLYGKTDPYVILRLGDQTIRSKKNSQTTVIGPPGEPIWNQDFNLLVQNPKKQKLYVEVVDSLGFVDVSTGTAEVDLSTLQDTVVADKVVVVTGGWNLLRKGNSGEVLLRLTYKAYVEDEEDEGTKKDVATTDISEEDDASDTDEPDVTYKQRPEIPIRDLGKESFMDVLAALIVSEEFQGIVASETGNPRVGNGFTSAKTVTPKPKGESISSGDSQTSKGSAVFWLSVITIVAVVIALNVGGSNLFNP
ncbi:synaptotagmin-4-like [Silene latifolia]|uniref:synaptotagmin-4-like n=1 Tax=Silene latifolia TaxID=37657 RepID=UPI003D76BF70